MNNPCCEKCLIYNSQDKDRKHPECFNPDCECHKNAKNECCDYSCCDICFAHNCDESDCPCHTAEKPYNQLDHNHCWESTNPPCGQKIEHLKCCLCELHNPKCAEKGHTDSCLEYRAYAGARNRLSFNAGKAAENRCKHGVHGIDCTKCFSTTDTSGWRERFREEFVAPHPFGNTLYAIKPVFLEAFIKKELERAREEGKNTRDEVWEEEIYKAGRAAEQSRIIALAEEIKKDIRKKEGKDVMSITGSVVYYFLQALISKIKNNSRTK